MSSKTKTTTTKENGKPALVPKLRFPEFRGTEGWHSGPLKDALSSISNGLALVQGNGSSGYRVTRIETISAGTIDLAKVGLIQTFEDISAYRLRVGDILLSNINSVAHIGKSVFVDSDYDLYHGMNLLRLEVNRNQHDPKFIFYAINTDWIRASLRERANKAVNQASINQTELGKTKVSLPLRPEQQKIAECLGSVDELIAAQARRVEALKTHKKGLMQQLFPREGETQPRLRFTEFKRAREWGGDTLGAVCELYQPVTLSSSELSMTGEHLVYGANGVIGTHNEYNHEDSEVAVTCRGATCGEVTITKPNSWITGNAMVVKPRTGKLSKDFIFQYLKSHGLKTVISGSAQPQITRAGFAPLAIFFPEPIEQQRIASCLSSLDALITAETQKLEALKTHKKGLMQQLFPSPEAAEA